MRTLRELYWAIKTKHLAPDFTLYEYWIWRMHYYIRNREQPLP